MLVRVLAGQRKADTYLFVAADQDMEELPEALLSLLGELRDVVELDLMPERQLVRCSGSEVLAAIAEVGYYLQLPPAEFMRS
jgi:uncharacterized protein YcgL (UPF0745 family)